MSEPKITESLLRALRAIQTLHSQRNQGVQARQLARELWPDSPGWSRTSNCGKNGAMRGKGPTFAATALLRRLSRLGLVRNRTNDNFISQYFLTDEGLAALKDSVSSVTPQVQALPKPRSKRGGKAQ